MLHIEPKLYVWNRTVEWFHPAGSAGSTSRIINKCTFSHWLLVSMQENGLSCCGNKLSRILCRCSKILRLNKCVSREAVWWKFSSQISCSGALFAGVHSPSGFKVRVARGWSVQTLVDVFGWQNLHHRNPHEIVCNDKQELLHLCMQTPYNRTVHYGVYLATYPSYDTLHLLDMHSFALINSATES